MECWRGGWWGIFSTSTSFFPGVFLFFWVSRSPLFPTLYIRRQLLHGMLEGGCWPARMKSGWLIGFFSLNSFLTTFLFPICFRSKSDRIVQIPSQSVTDFVSICFGGLSEVRVIVLFVVRCHLFIYQAVTYFKGNLGGYCKVRVIWYVLSKCLCIWRKRVQWFAFPIS